ncbi:thymidylate kinase [Streptomyces sp. NPDC006458]|uniref:thymidylate kinase n=1 Tax=Streptomyces sp. NPDC006458 TaxID=3154302 RepID=UPI0033BBFDDF
MLLALAGTDGVGKSTLTREVVAHLERRGRQVQTVDRWDIVDSPHYPAARFLDHDIKAIRRCVADMPAAPRLLFLMWSMGMALQAHREPHGDLVIVDGYWMKHAASEITYGLDPDWVETVVAGLPKADLTVRLRLDPELAWKRKQGDLVPYECGMDPSCSRDSFFTHQQAIADRLDLWAKRDGWPSLDTDRPVEHVAADLAALIETT